MFVRESCLLAVLSSLMCSVYWDVILGEMKLFACQK